LRQRADAGQLDSGPVHIVATATPAPPIYAIRFALSAGYGSFVSSFFFFYDAGACRLSQRATACRCHFESTFFQITMPAQRDAENEERGVDGEIMLPYATVRSRTHTKSGYCGYSSRRRGAFTICLSTYAVFTGRGAVQSTAGAATRVLKRSSKRTAVHDVRHSLPYVFLSAAQEIYKSALKTAHGLSLPPATSGKPTITFTRPPTA